MSYFRGRHQVTGEGLQVGMEEDRIADVKPIDYSGSQWNPAGLIDLQVNRFCRFDLNNGTVTSQCLLSLAKKLLVYRAPIFVPTVFTDSENRIPDVLRPIRDARGNHASLAQEM
jgi:N-acetylglucosamine-6-phosphate deacetylase